jgi:hypothetical protein
MAVCNHSCIIVVKRLIYAYINGNILAGHPCKARGVFLGKERKIENAEQ